MSCMYFHRPPRVPDDSTESSDSITYWRKLLGQRGGRVASRTEPGMLVDSPAAVRLSPSPGCPG
jgi:hypothetical protein